MSRRAQHLAEMRIALAERCSLPEARRRLAMLRHSAAQAAFDKARGNGGAPVEQVAEPAPQYWWNRD